MSTHHWADEAILGQGGPPSLLRRLGWKLKRLLGKGIRLSLIICSTTALVVLGISCLSPDTLYQAEQARKEIHNDAKHMMKRNVIPASKEAVNELKRLGGELFPDKEKDSDSPNAKQQL